MLFARLCIIDMQAVVDDTFAYVPYLAAALVRFLKSHALRAPRPAMQQL